ncbi:CoA transferase [Ramlibacter sp. AN1015]|uniref:CaiB/BaiF CoA transferase family protein n=1 Tax=Ramlibacter sp. AN1015 TaxID=3133428 RepID=UPI0030C391BD
MPGPLDGVRVLDLTSVVMGPYATSVLAELGADVVKVEPPGGEVMRKSGPMRHDDMGHFYLAINRNKRSVVLDLKREAARKLLLRMAAASDVLVYNIRPQAMERLGLGYEVLSEANPRLLYVGAYGFSQKGPYAARPAYDDLIQGMVGIPWLSQQAGADKPRYSPVVLVDRMVGLQLANAITSGLYYRERSGRGQRIDVPMFEGMLSVILGEHLAGRAFEPPVGPTGYQRSLAKDRRPYRTKDGWLCAIVYNDKQWGAFFDAIGRPEVFAGDACFHSQNSRLTHIDHVYGFLADTLATRTSDEWLHLFEQADIPAARMVSIEDMLIDEHVQATGFVREVEHPTEGTVRITAIPTEWSESVPRHRSHAPLPGENTREVLREIGIAPEEIETLFNTGAAHQAGP